MFSKKIMDQIEEAEKKRKGYSHWNGLATILALGVIGPLLFLLFNRYTAIVAVVLFTYWVW